MNGALPDGPRGRLLAVGLTLILLALAWVGVAEPLIGWHGSLAAAAENRGAVARRMEAVAETLPQLRAAATAPETRAAAPLLEGATDALAGAALQARLRELAAEAQISLTSTETLPATDEAALRRIGLRIAARRWNKRKAQARPARACWWMMCNWRRPLRSPAAPAVY